MEYIKSILNNSMLFFFFILLIIIILDILFGTARAIKEKKLNSSLGKNGLIKKITMIICVLLLFIVDYLIAFNLVGFVPNNILTIINIEFVGIADFFAIMFILFECVSVLKNMSLIDLPIPKKINDYINKSLDHYKNDTKN